MHPIILFNHHQPGELERAKAAGDEILRFCIAQGGSITGEHGVGMEKMELVGEQFPDQTLNMISRFKNLFDPECRLNPGKMLPTGKGCMEIRQPASMHI
jgi:glycolate oxidase